MPQPIPHRVLIAGGGVAGLEAVIALHALAGDRVDVTVIAPDEHFVIRALSVREPFARPASRHHRVADPESTTVTTASGDELTYDSLLVALGARAFHAFDRVTTLRGQHDSEAMHGIIHDVEGGDISAIAFVVPTGVTWPLPVYEPAAKPATIPDDTPRRHSIGVAIISHDGHLTCGVNADLGSVPHVDVLAGGVRRRPGRAHARRARRIRPRSRGPVMGSRLRIAGCQAHGWLLHQTKGRVLGRVAGRPVLLLTTTGRRSGVPRTTPVQCRVHDGLTLVVAAAGGAPHPPAWLFNIMANSGVTVEVAGRRTSMSARVLAGEEREAAWRRLSSADPQLISVRHQANRTLPVTALDGPLPASASAEGGAHA